MQDEKNVYKANSSESELKASGTTNRSGLVTGIERIIWRRNLQETQLNGTQQ